MGREIFFGWAKKILFNILRKLKLRKNNFFDFFFFGWGIFLGGEANFLKIFKSIFLFLDEIEIEKKQFFEILFIAQYIRI